jgi:membrane protein YdbS with pleckstrin-like domain
VAISKNLLNEGEEVVFDVRTHWKALILPFLALILLLAVSVFVDRAIDNGTVSAGVWIIILGLILWLSVWPFLNWLVASYTVTNRRLITRYGVITRRGHDIPLTRIRHARDQRRQHARPGAAPRHPTRGGAAARPQRPAAPSARRHPRQ